MKYCTHCGQQISEKRSFCTECGTKQTIEPTVPTEETVLRREGMSQQSKQPMSKKSKIWMTVTSILIVGFISAHFIISFIVNPMKDVQAMDRAMTEGDVEAFFQLIHLDKNALLHKEEYMNFIKQSGWESIRTQISEVIQKNERNSFDYKIVDQHGNELFVMKKKPFLLGIYHTYEIEAIPTQVQVVTNFAPSTVTIGSHTKELSKASVEVDFGKAYPGTYELKGKASNEFGESSSVKTVDVTSEKDQEQLLRMEFPIQQVAFETDRPEAILFVNGGSTGNPLSDYEVLGPIPKNEELELHAEWTDEEGETHRTETITSPGDTRSPIVFQFEEESEETLPTNSNLKNRNSLRAEDAQAHVLNFRRAYEQALNTIDYSKISSYLAPGSTAANELKEYIGDLKDEGFTYNFTENSVLSTEHYRSDSFVVTTNEKFIFTNHRGQQTHYNRYKDYTVTKTGAGYKIKAITINKTIRSDM